MQRREPFQEEVDPFYASIKCLASLARRVSRVRGAVVDVAVECVRSANRIFVLMACLVKLG
jgi:hypothetical protein